VVDRHHLEPSTRKIQREEAGAAADVENMSTGGKPERVDPGQGKVAPGSVDQTEKRRVGSVEVLPVERLGGEVICHPALVNVGNAVLPGRSERRTHRHAGSSVLCARLASKP
jgi:hypothetical protein